MYTDKELFKMIEDAEKHDDHTAGMALALVGAARASDQEHGLREILEKFMRTLRGSMGKEGFDEHDNANPVIQL